MRWDRFIFSHLKKTIRQRHILKEKRSEEAKCLQNKQTFTNNNDCNKLLVFRTNSSPRTRCTTTEWLSLSERYRNIICFSQSQEIPLALERVKHLHNDGNPSVLSSKGSQSQMTPLHTVINRYETGAFGCPTTTWKTMSSSTQGFSGNSTKISNFVDFLTFRNINLQNLRRASAFIDIMDRKVDQVKIEEKNNCKGWISFL